MKKILCLLMCGTTLTVSAQMLDLIGSGAVSGTMTKGSIQSVNQGLTVFKQTQIIQALTQNAHLIRIQYMGNYSRVGRSDITSHSFKPYTFDVGSEGNNRFYIVLSDVDVEMCQKLADTQVGAISVEINGTKGNRQSCTNTSEIKFIFE